ncbi:MAG: MarR family transcriptional regulator [Erysipelotrichaceae bacterium]|nr:MarR family transcriptional regulator [Erysipelotrichaceae bacterium]
MKNTDIHYYIKILNNYIEKLHYTLYDQKECSINHLWVIDFLYDQEDDVYQKDIEKEFSINRATASKMLKLMEDKQMVQRVPSNHDARLKKIILLDKGLELHQTAVDVRKTLENTLTASLTDEEIMQFKLISQKMLKGLEENI